MANSFETGGEVLTVGSKVVVFDGNSQRELAITSIGTKRIFIESAYGFKPVPFSKEDRSAQQGAYHQYFKTLTEVANEQIRASVKSRLRDLGIEARIVGHGKDGLDRYSTETLRQVAELLDRSLLNTEESQRG
ncbi:hypothetical protein SEA_FRANKENWEENIE_146 [Streptomyces phage Frankenweenie]|nr:hypothetical protein SEA_FRANKENWEENIE_146 [Streptomyces phage Frankenweenie]